MQINVCMRRDSKNAPKHTTLYDWTAPDTLNKNDACAQGSLARLTATSAQCSSHDALLASGRVFY